ncbi:MAG TPA: NADH-quinone oxidoreductase subunit J [Castellaniella sp.]|nr:NADH-quinone oxidoreductase subunit J [Castellaniella sp.]
MLCIVAGVGTILLLPSPIQLSLRRLGGVLLALAGLVFLALIVHHSAHHAQGTAHTFYFWVFSAIALFGAIRVVTHQRPVYSALYFVLTVFASSGLFVLLAAEFMAAALVIIYAGAILITYVFVIMLAAAARSPDASSAAQQMADYDHTSRDPFVASAIGFVLMGVFLFVIFDRAEDLSQNVARPVPAIAAVRDGAPNVSGDTQELGVYLFNNQQVSLELAGLLLTVAMVGAIVIARRRVFRDQPVHVDEPGETVVFPATPVDDNPNSIPVYGTDNPLQKAYPEA